jgi:hypothetical protein
MDKQFKNLYILSILVKLLCVPILEIIYIFMKLAFEIKLMKVLKQTSQVYDLMMVTYSVSTH